MTEIYKSFTLPTTDEVGSILQDSQAQADAEAIQIVQNRQDLENRIEAKKLRLADRAARRTRTAGEQIGDFAASAGVKGAIGLGQILYGGAELLSQTQQGQTTLKGVQQLVNLVSGQEQEAPRSLDQATKPIIEAIGSEGTLGQQFQKARQYVDTELLSDPLAYSKEQINEASARRAEDRGDRVDKLIEEGHSEFMANVREEASEFVDTLKDYADNPIAAVDVALESLPQLFVGGAAGKAATQGLVAKGASQEVIEQAATRAGIASTAVQEGLSNAVEAQAQVNDMSVDQLKKDSPLFNELVKGGMSEDNAKAEVANRAFQITGALAATAGAVTSKVTGAGKFEGNLFNKDSKLGGIINKFSRTVTNTAKEAAEETLQGASGQLASNVAIKATADKNKEIGEGVGSSAATGLVAGGVSGGSVATSKEVIQAASETIEAPVKKVTDAVKQTKDVSTALESEETAQEARNEASESYDPSTAFDVAIDPSQVPTEPQARKEHIGELQTHLDNMKQEALATAKEVSALPTETQEEKNAAGKAQQELTAVLKRYKTAQGRLEALKTTDAVTPENAESKLEDIPTNKQELLGSTRTLSDEQLETLSTSSDLSAPERQRVKNTIETRKAIAEVEAIDAGKVHDDIINGSGGNLGIVQHQAKVQDFTDAGNKDKARTALKNFVKFAKSHGDKVKAIRAAYNAHVKSPNSEQALKLSAQVQEQYGLKIHKGSNATGLIDRMNKEIVALQKAYAESLAYAKANFASKVDAPVSTKVDAPVQETKVEVPTIDLKKDVLDQNETIKSNFDKVEKSKSLLHTVPNLFKTLTTTNFYADKMSDAQKQAVVPVKNFQAKFGKKLKEVMVRRKKDDKYLDEDFTQHLLNDKGEMDDNTAAAFGMVSMNWLATRAGDTLFNKDAEIKSILGNDDESTVGIVASKVLRNIGSTRTVVAETMGKDIVKALGLKAKKDTDGDAQAKLEMSAGQLAIRTLAEAGLVELTAIDNKDLDRFRDEPSSDAGQVVFVKAVSNEDGKLADAITEVRDTIKDSDGLLEHLFGIESYQTRPSLSKPKVVVDTIKGTFNKIPTRIQKLIKKHQDRPVQNKHNVAKPFMFLSDKGRMVAAGAKLDYEKTTHITERDSVKAVNDGIERSIEHFAEHYERTGSKKFYFSHNIVKNMRMMMQSNTVNMQSDKIHRHLMGYSNWEVEINPRNPDHMQQFFTAVAESLGEGVDKQNGQESWIAAKALFNSPIIQEVIDAINRVNSGMYDEGQPTLKNVPSRKETEEAILAGIAEGGEGIFTLDGLAAFAAYKKADGKPFKTNIFREVDGVTNGVIIGLYQLAAAGDYETLLNQLERGAMFSDDTTNWSDWYKKVENNDSYQDMAVDWSDYLHSIKETVSVGVTPEDKKARQSYLVLKGNPLAMQGLETLVGAFMEDNQVTKLARNLTKNPLMITNYGAATQKTRKEFSEKILAKVYADITKAAVKNDQAAIDNITKELSTILGKQLTLKADQALDAQLTTKEENQFKAYVDAYYGQALEMAIESKFGTFINHRTQLNKALQISFEAFNTVYTRRIKEQEAELGRKLGRDEKLALVEELKDVVPTFRSPMAESTGDSIVVMKDKKVRRTDASSKVSTKFTKKQKIKKISIDDNGNVSEKDTFTKSANTSISSYEYADGGVSGTILGIHSIDAATMYGLLEEYSALNVHDAAAFSLLDTMQGTEALNKSFYDTLTNYNMREEIQESMERSIRILRDGKNRQDTTTFLRSIMSKGLLGEYDTLGKYLNAFRAETRRQNALRKEVTDRLTHVQQYNPGQGGHYTPEKAQNTSTATKQGEADIAKAEVKAFLKSSKKTLDPDNFGATVVQQVDAMNQTAVFNALGKIGNVQETPEHSTYLANLLNTLSTKLDDPIKLQMRKGGSETYGATRGNEVFINAGSGSLVNGTQMSSQEVYVHEIVHTVTREGVDNVSMAKRELIKLFKKAEKHIKPEDFLNRDAAGNVLDLNGNVITAQSAGYASELAAATERYDYIFNNTDSTNGKNAYLHEFVALGLTNKNFRNALSKITGTTERDSIVGNTILEKLGNAFLQIVDWFTDRITGTAGLMADKKLMRLAEQLAHIDSRKKSTLYKMMDKANEKTREAIVDFIIEPMLKLGDSKLVQRSKSSIVRNVGGIAASIPHIDAKAFSQTVEKVGRRMNISKQNLASSLVTEAIGATKDNNVFHTLLRKSVKMVDQARTHIKTGVIKQVNDKFLTDISQSAKNSLTKGLLKTDVSSLMDDYTWKEISSLIGSKETRDKEIAKLEAQLKQFKGREHYYRKMATSLGNYMATGRHLEVHGHYNAYSIAHEDGTGNKPKDDAAQAIPVLDKLATLRALEKTPEAVLESVSQTIKNEFKADAVNNGVTFMLQLHADYKKRSLDKLFGGNPTLTQKGYTKEIYNPNVSVVVATLDEEDVLIREGYTRELKPLNTDPDNPMAKDVYRYISRDNLVGTWESGISSTTNNTAKGTDLVQVYLQRNTDNPAVEARTEGQRIFNIKDRKVKAVYGKADTANHDTMLNPIYDEFGGVTGYRYMMDEATKDRILEKDNSVDRVLGAMEAAISDKMNSKDINAELVRTAKKDFDEKYSSNPDNYVIVGKNSTNKEYLELYNLMPYEMKQDIRKVWGQDNMYVPEELVTMMFGRRKWSGASRLIKTDAFQNLNKHVLNNWNVNLGSGLLKFENIWQEIVKTVKDVIVIKSGVVFLGNVMSNLVLLKTYGVSFLDIARSHATATRYAHEYQKDTQEAEALERELKVNPNMPNAKRVKVKLARLKDSIAKNPVKELIDEGIYQSIVEDVDVEDDQFTYKSKLQEWITPKFVADGKVPQVLTDIGHNLVISHETKLYKAMRDSTQLSDFVARYTLHQHNLKNGMSKEDSFKNIVDSFINYELPTHKGIQYANDMGLLMFTKFFVRIQKVIAHLASKRTANFLGVILLQNALDTDVEDIFDSFVSPDTVGNKFHTPYDVGSTLLDLPLLNLIEGTVG